VLKLYLNRLKTVWKDDPSAQQSVVTLAMNYDPLGNMTAKSDIGTMSYDPTGRPHALQQIVPTGTYLPCEHHIDYFSSGRTKKISDEINDIEIRKIEFTYGPDDQRRKMVFPTGTNTTITRYYQSGFEEDEYSDGRNKKTYYISTPDGLTAMRIVSTTAGQTDENLYYVTSDYLGSICGLMDGTGAMQQEYSYDAWGARRDPATWQNYTQTQLTTYSSSLITDRGYTGHEMLDLFGLINMNGRMYDPVVARFLSPDNFVQTSFNSLGFNRYSYCFNNPLINSDADGEWVQYVIGAVVGGVVNWAAHGCTFDTDGLVAFGIGAGAGVLAVATFGASLAAYTGSAAMIEGAGGFIGGGISGAYSYSAATLFQSSANHIYFNDRLPSPQQLIVNATIAFITAGSLQGFTALANGRSFFNGSYNSIQPLPIRTVSEIPALENSAERVDPIPSKYPREINQDLVETSTSTIQQKVSIGKVSTADGIVYTKQYESDLYTVVYENSRKTSIYMKYGSASEYFKEQVPNWDGSMSRIPNSNVYRIDSYTADNIRITLMTDSKSTFLPSVKILYPDKTEIFFRFPNF
jgi:RHS repeat-associated protein